MKVLIDFLVCSIALTLGIAFLYEGVNSPRFVPGVAGIVSSPGFPGVVFSIPLIILSVLLLVNIIRKEGVKLSREFDKSTLKRTLVLIVIIFGYIMSFGRINFTMSTAVFLAVTVIYLNKSMNKPVSLLKAIIYAIIGSILICEVFTNTFRIILP